MTGQLIVFPLPLLTFFLSGFAAALVLRHDFGAPETRYLFAAFFAVVATGGLLVALRFGYGDESLIALQRAMPLFVGPLLYLAFASLTVSSGAARRLAAAHLSLAVGLAVLPQLLLTAPVGFDWLIGLSYLVYAVLLLAIWRKGPNTLVRARLESANRLARWAAPAAGFLLMLLVFDTVIAVNFAAERPRQAVAFVSYGSMLLAAVLSVVIYFVSTGSTPRGPEGPSVEAEVRDAAPIIAAVNDLLIREKLYMDSDLTVDRLARRLHVPARTLSEAVNRHERMNLSQYVNGFRLRRAAELLAATDISVTDVMEQSGFLTRSNFYREFQRKFGQTPTAYRRAQRRD